MKVVKAKLHFLYHGNRIQKNNPRGKFNAKVLLKYRGSRLMDFTDTCEMGIKANVIVQQCGADDEI